MTQLTGQSYAIGVEYSTLIPGLALSQKTR